jgi:hypothetical protein
MPQFSSSTTADIEQKEKCFSVASDLLGCAQTNKNFLKRKENITGDETWVYSYNSGTKQESKMEIPFLTVTEKKHTNSAEN